MKVAFFTYPAAFQNVGGGEIQLIKTREYLEKAGQPVDLFDPWRHRVEDYDLLHVFSSVKDCLGLVQVARSRGVKVVTSPVLWSDWRRAFFTDDGIRMKVGLLTRHALKWLWPSFPSGRLRLLLESDLLLPNSETEKKQIVRLFAVPASKIRVIHNGVDPDFMEADPKLYRDRFGGDPFLLSVGRVEPRKNQLNLIRAVKGTGLRLHLIGSSVSGYESYEAACRRVGNGFVRFTPTVPHDDPLLKSAYAACELFVLQGWFETPGLAALEAGLAGAKVLATSGGSTREYFEDSVDYLNPADPSDIRRAIHRALTRPKNERLRNRVRERFTWNHVASACLESYRSLSEAS